ncbi:hypothetical protein BpHYR1_034056 [Brachionus plicatilis]|uniref:Uncharacterized protein n=1 Tax=Brachionus plicatilis TaxID=10195 RepID=A0A3M7S0H1_BRAPC|nr:hypothetical protein BpHYR1_034056 [Brachionus plicatilis]
MLDLGQEEYVNSTFFFSDDTWSFHCNNYTQDELERIDWYQRPYLKSSLTNRISTMWNQLPDSIVNASSLNIFKARLDFWLREEENRKKLG